MLIVAVHYGSYLRADKYLYKVVDQPFDFHAFFSSNHFVQILHLFVHLPFLRIFGNLRTLINRTAKLEIILFCSYELLEILQYF